MFTMEDLQTVKSAGHNLFSPERSRLAYELSLMTGTERGVCAEKMLYDRFVKDGWDVEHIGGSNAHDIQIVHAGTVYKIEVKLATYGLMYRTTKKNYYGYQFRNVKPNLFNILFMVFVTPDGIIVKWTDQEEVLCWTCDKKEGPTGYTITANSSRKIKDMLVLDFDEFYPFLSGSLWLA